jgi:class 3 adenylate cyclase
MAARVERARTDPGSGPPDRLQLPTATPHALRAELAASIERTLREEGRRNELAIAAIRAVTLGAMCCVEAWLVAGRSALGPAALPAAAVTLSYFAAATGLWWSLRRGLWHPLVGYVTPVVDAAYTAFRVGVVFVIAGHAHVVQAQELSTITALGCLLAVSGAFRLDPRAVGWTTALAEVLYIGFAQWIGMAPWDAVVHVVLIGAVGLVGSGLTRLVGRAVQSEVTRLTLRRFLPAPVVDAADSDPLALLTEPRAIDATIVVTDLRGFTTWAEHRTPLEVLGVLNEVQGALASAVVEEGGMIDKFMGDGMLAVFGAPRATPDHADRALAAVRRMRERTAKFEVLRLGVGVHSGEVVVGCVGSGIRLEFTVLGDTVNTASRLEAATKDHGVQVLISDATRARATTPLTEVGEIGIRGRQERLVAWTL